MKGIGGYIELDTYFGKEYHEHAIAVNSGRHALEYLIKANNIKKLYLPYVLCSSIKNLCIKCGCNYEMYHVDKKLEPIFHNQLGDNEYLYIVNYYGQLDDACIQALKSNFVNIVVDNAQDFFRNRLDGIDTIYTCRKYFGVCDGGYVYIKNRCNIELSQDISYPRMNYVLGRLEDGAEKFYKESSENNKYFSTVGLKYMSKLTHNLLRGIDYNTVIEKRNKNFEFLNKHLSKKNRLALKQPNGAFMYPFFTQDGIRIKKKLIEHKIYVPTLWNDVFETVGYCDLEADFVNNIVPLPIDQRYDHNDMSYILEVLDVFIT